MTSQYDRLHDKYLVVETTKAGTRYERLTALVAKALHETSTVVHDVRLVGDSAVSHQIDVHIERAGQPWRVLIECKDFDVSGDKVGLDIVRSFWAVADDVKPDEAIIITCNGFTEGASKFAKAKAIKLAVIRAFEEGADGLFCEFHIGCELQTLTQPKVRLVLEREEDHARLLGDLGAEGITGGVRRGNPVFVITPAGRTQLNDFVSGPYGAHSRDLPGPVTMTLRLTDGAIEVDTRGAIPLHAIVAEFEVHHARETQVISSTDVAELLVAGFGPGDDLIIFDKDLRRFAVNPETGKVEAA